MTAHTTDADKLVRPAPGSGDHDAAFIGGRWVRAGGAERLPVHDSGTEAVIGSVRSGTLADVDAAVAAARAALPGWSKTAPVERARMLRALHDRLVPRASELAALIAAEVGTSARMSGPIQVASALTLLTATADIVADMSFEERVGVTLVVREPVGVVAAITPWNYPLFQIMAKVAGALAAGCTVVHKPAGLAPLSAFVLAEAVEQAGLPAGVYNLVPGPGAILGEALAAHPGVDMVSFTGSTTAGTRVYQLAAAGIKRVALELGGKSASIALEDAVLANAVKGTVNSAFLNSGQTCNAWTRLLVPRAKVAEAVELAVAGAQRLTLGDQFDEKTRLGPLVSAAQVETVRGYVAGALRDGAVAATGGAAKPAGLNQGYFAAPTVLTHVTPEMTIAREEVFGPVLVVLGYDSEEQALAIANDTEYGLSGAVWSEDPARALAFARGIRSGQVDVNGGRFNPLAPAGGMKKSGIGREFGRYGIEEFLELKSIQVPAV